MHDQFIKFFSAGRLHADPSSEVDLHFFTGVFRDWQKEQRDILVWPTARIELELGAMVIDRREGARHRKFVLGVSKSDPIFERCRAETAAQAAKKAADDAERESESRTARLTSFEEARRIDTANQMRIENERLAALAEQDRARAAARIAHDAFMAIHNTCAAACEYNWPILEYAPGESVTYADIAAGCELIKPWESTQNNWYPYRRSTDEDVRAVVRFSYGKNYDGVDRLLDHRMTDLVEPVLNSLSFLGPNATSDNEDWYNSPRFLAQQAWRRQYDLLRRRPEQSYSDRF